MAGRKKKDGIDLDMPLEETKKKNKKKIILIVVASVIVVLGIAATIIYFYFINRINYETADDVIMAPSDLSEEELANVTEVPKLKNDSNIINVLLVGEEAISMSTGVMETDSRGRSDCNIVLTINRKKKTVKLISFLRDTLVNIPGYRPNKLNAAYQFGGGPLLQDTLQLNFGVITDGYIRVKFSDFKKIINALGGVDITLTESEAYCLNNTNYISKKKYRNVKTGKNHMNGVQALGYCRIRKGKDGRAVTSKEGHNNDWGRTERQKNVLKAIFEEYKTKSMAELVSVANEILPLATTNMDSDELLAILGVVMDLKIDELETLSLPMETEYTPTASGALQINYETMSKKVSDFINGVEIASPSPSAN